METIITYFNVISEFTIFLLLENFPFSSDKEKEGGNLFKFSILGKLWCCSKINTSKEQNKLINNEHVKDI